MEGGRGGGDYSGAAWEWEEFGLTVVRRLAARSYWSGWMGSVNNLSPWVKVVREGFLQ